MNKRKSIFLYSDAFEQYHYPPECPFKTERAVQTYNTLNSMSLFNSEDRKVIAPLSAERELLELVHTAKYLNALIESEKGNWNIDALNMGIGGPDNPVFNGMYGYGALACGATLKGAEMLLSGEAKVAFNPSGGHHHARPELASGFCYINDVAIACKYLVKNNNKALYLDVDVHHGDGVQNVFYDQKEVMTISMHESGKTLFPGTGFEEDIGIGDGKGYAVNIPLPGRTYNQAYMKCFREIVEPLAKAFVPDVIVFELGADALAGDPLAHLQLTNDVYRKILRFLLKLNKPLLITGGGGYHIENTVRAWALAWAIVTGEDQNLADMNMGMGGVMLESTDWMGGLQDREIPVTEIQRDSVEPVIQSIIQKIKEIVFPIHFL